MYVRLAKKLIKYIYNPSKNQRNLFKNDMHTNIFVSVLTSGMWLESSSENYFLTGGKLHIMVKQHNELESVL